MPPDRLYFPGGQPVSLDRANLGKLRQMRYWVTWKADGTRYMLLLCQWAVYLIDRSFAVRRVQVREISMLLYHLEALVLFLGKLELHHTVLADLGVTHWQCRQTQARLSL